MESLDNGIETALKFFSEVEEARQKVPTQSRGAKRDGAMMRRLAVELGIPFLTTIAAAGAATAAIRALRDGEVETNPLKSYHSIAP